MGLTRRQAITLVPTLAFGAFGATVTTKEALAASMIQPKRCGGLDYQEWDSIAPMVRSIMRHAWETGDTIFSADIATLRRIRFIATRGPAGPRTRVWWLDMAGVPTRKLAPEPPDPGLSAALGPGWFRDAESRAAACREINRWAELCRRPSNPCLGEPPYGCLVLP